jgi:hypothetical protein
MRNLFQADAICCVSFVDHHLPAGAVVTPYESVDAARREVILRGDEIWIASSLHASQ